VVYDFLLGSKEIQGEELPTVWASYCGAGKLLPA
jgi:hypothetical protein